MNFTTYDSPEMAALPDGLYLALFHGRADLEQSMDEWGFDGPVIPILGLHVTYFGHLRVRLRSEHQRDVHDATVPDQAFYEDSWQSLRVIEDLVRFDGKFYGDWCVFNMKNGEVV